MGRPPTITESVPATRLVHAVLLAGLLAAVPASAMSPELAASVETAIGNLTPPLAFATRLALVEARLVSAAELAAEDGPAAAEQAAAATEYLTTIVPPPRSLASLAGLAADLAALGATSPNPAAWTALRADVASLQAPSFQPGLDPTLNRLRTIELLLQVASALYAEAVGPEGEVLSSPDLRFARGIVLTAHGLYGSIERDLDSRVQGVTAGLTSTLRMIDRQFETDPAAGLPRPDQVAGTIAFFLGYSAYF